MTLPRFRRRADDDQDATEHLQAIRPADWDGTTITFGGASGAGLPPDELYAKPGMSEPGLKPSQPVPGQCNATDGFSVCTEPPGHGPTHWDRRTQHEWSDDADPAAGLRQAIELTALAERGPGPGTGRARLRVMPPPDPAGQYGDDTGSFARCRRCQAFVRPGPHCPNCDAPGDYDYPAAPQPAPPVRHDDDTMARGMEHGWPHLFEVRCAHPAAQVATPIPCGAVHRDATAISFRGLRASAWAAGWHLDALGRWTCPGCCQASPGYRTLYPVTVWDPDAAEARLARDPDAEFAYRAAAEYDLFRAVRDATRHGRHAGGAR